MTARAEGREGEGETLLSLARRQRHAHTRARAPTYWRRRSVSLQKGTNQPATRMSLNRSQRSCRSTKYGTQAKT